jgi:[ribosomal protein S18]-alanine N-acetyltransferase
VISELPHPFRSLIAERVGLHHIPHSSVLIPAGMLYRLYEPTDFAQLYAVEEICFQPPYRFSRAYMRQIVTSAAAATWMAEESGAIAGFAIVEWSLESNQTTAYIQTIEVLPQFRRMGVANELMRRLEDSAIRAGASLIWLHVDAENSAAQRLYERHAYACQGREENYYPRGRAALIYLKPLELAPKSS